jgi:acyl carrier protein
MSIAKKIIEQAIANICNDPSVKVVIVNSPDFPLLDNNSTIDSLTLVNLFIEIESLIEKDLGIEISVVTENSFESDAQPFKNVASLISHVDGLLS